MTRFRADNRDVVGPADDRQEVRHEIDRVDRVENRERGSRDRAVRNLAVAATKVIAQQLRKQHHHAKQLLRRRLAALAEPATALALRLFDVRLLDLVGAVTDQILKASLAVFVGTKRLLAFELLRIRGVGLMNLNF